MVQLIVEYNCVDSAVEDWISRFGRLKYRLPMINSLVVEVPESAAPQLSRLTGVTAVFENTCITAQASHHQVPERIPQPEGRFADTKLQKAFGVRHATDLNALNIRGLSGKSVTVAVLDTGVAPVDDLTKPQNRLLAFVDFINRMAEAYDDNGHGTHVAGIAAGNGYRSNGLFMGIAPGSGVVGIKTLDSDGKGTAADMLAGLQWVVDNRDKYSIRVVNMSVGATDPVERDPLVRAVEAVWDLGICVVAAAGNNGPAPGSVTSPGVSRKVITVGAADDGDVAQIMGNTVQHYSGRGPTLECIVKPDVLAPGNDIISAMAPNRTPWASNSLNKRPAKLPEKTPIAGHYLKMSGTSMAAPIVSGTVALLLERSPELTPDDVKYMLRICAADLNCPHNQQGCGVLNIGAVLREEAKHVRDL